MGNITLTTMKGEVEVGPHKTGNTKGRSQKQKKEKKKRQGKKKKED